MSDLQRVMHRANRNYWIARVDDLTEKYFGFSVFDLPDEDYDELNRLYIKGLTPEKALEIVHTQPIEDTL